MAFAIIAEHLSANEPLRAVVNSGWTHSDPRISNRYNATMPVAQALPGRLATATGDHVAL